MWQSKITKRYDYHQSERVLQGDILRDFEFIIIGKNQSELKLNFPYVIVISQDCDLEQSLNIPERSDDEEITFNQYLHTILITPAFLADDLRSGTYLEGLFNIKSDPINSKRWRLVKNNQNPRYHYLLGDQDLQVPEMVVDFKAYYTLHTGYFRDLHSDNYLASINELFREDLSQRFANYLNRIGLPEI